MLARISGLLAHPRLYAVAAAAVCGAATAAAWTYTYGYNCSCATVEDWSAEEMDFLRSWGLKYGWDVAKWDTATVHLFLMGHPRLACLRPFKKSIWSDVDGESLLAMNGADFEGKGVPPCAIRKLMRCVCDASTQPTRNAENLVKPAPHEANGNTKERDLLADSVLACSYFSLLHRSEIDLLLLNATQKRHPPGTTILAAGKPASDFSIVLEGSVMRFTQGDIVIDQGFKHFGEQFLVKKCSVSTTSVCAGSKGCRLLMVSAETWGRLLARGLRWVTTANRRMMLSVRHRFGKYLRQIPFLSNVDRSSLDVLGSLFNTQSFNRGDSILVKGEPSKGLYLIMSGTVEIRLPQERDSTCGDDSGITKSGAFQGEQYESRYLCDSDAHNYFGEVSLMSDGHVVSASVVAAQPAMLLHISPQSFQQFLACTGDDVVKQLREEALLRIRKHSKNPIASGNLSSGYIGDGKHANGEGHADPRARQVPLAAPNRRARRFSEAHPLQNHPELVPHVASFTSDHDRAHDNIRVQLETGFAVPPSPALELWAETPEGAEARGTV